MLICSLADMTAYSVDQNNNNMAAWPLCLDRAPLNNIAHACEVSGEVPTLICTSELASTLCHFLQADCISNSFHNVDIYVRFFVLSFATCNHGDIIVTYVVT